MIGPGPSHTVAPQPRTNERSACCRRARRGHRRPQRIGSTKVFWRLCPFVGRKLRYQRSSVLIVRRSMIGTRFFVEEIWGKRAWVSKANITTGYSGRNKLSHDISVFGSFRIPFFCFLILDSTPLNESGFWGEGHPEEQGNNLIRAGSETDRRCP